MSEDTVVVLNNVHLTQVFELAKMFDLEVKFFATVSHTHVAQIDYEPDGHPDYINVSPTEVHAVYL